MSSIVVADSGPLHYLILIDCAEILEQLFDRVVIPVAVRDQLLHSSAPTKVKDWINSTKAWLYVETVLDPQPISGLHEGEAEALQLALQIKPAGVLMDDLDGRAAARRLGISVIGTLGLLERAAEKEFTGAPACHRQTSGDKFFLFQRDYLKLLWKGIGNATNYENSRS